MNRAGYSSGGGFWRAGVLVAVTGLVNATADGAQPRFRLDGNGTLTQLASQGAGRFDLKAALQAVEPATSPQTQSGGRFGLTATASSSSLVCYNDTIFRDDFDGDGF